MMKSKWEKICSFVKENKGILIVMLLLFVQRFMALYELGISYSLNSDDLSYVNSGIHFIKTGTISMHNEFPSAQIMPGMTVFIGLLSLLFGQGKLLWLVLKLIWIAMGTLTAWFIYKSVTLFTPKWCGILASLALFRADIVWMDNTILTETPFMLFLTMMVYYTLKMPREKGYKAFIGLVVSYMLALMLKANIAPYALFVLIYLLIAKYNKKLLWKQIAIAAVVVVSFVIPWSIRNFVQFKAFVPLTYGAGNPTLLGTYQGINYPKDEALDYETNVNQVVKEKYTAYCDEEGKVLPQYARYVSLEKDAIKAKYRQQVWAKTDLKSMVYSYLVIKPREMITSIFYWDEVFGIKSDQLKQLPFIELIACVFSLFAAFYLKRFRKPICFALGVYIANIYIYAMTFSFSRYNASLLSLRYIAMGIGAYLAIQLLAKVLCEIKGQRTNV